MRGKSYATAVVFVALSLSGCQTVRTLTVDSAKQEIQVSTLQCARDYADVVLKNGNKVERFRIDEKTDGFIAGWPYYARSKNDYKKIYFKDIKSITLIQDKSPMACLRL